MNTNDNDDLRDQMLRHLLKINKKTNNGITERLQSALCCFSSESCECCCCTLSCFDKCNENNCKLSNIAKNEQVKIVNEKESKKIE